MTYQRALQKISQATGFEYSRLVKIFKGKAADAKRIAALKNIRAGFFRFLDNLEIEKLRRQGVTGTKKELADFFKFKHKVAAYRIKYKYYKYKSKIPKRFLKSAKKISRGKHKGQYAVYFDSLYDRAVDFETAKKLRHDNRIVRMATRLAETEFKDFGKFKKYLSKKQKKQIEKGLVPYDVAEEIAEEIADDFYDQEVFEDFTETFGYVQ